jgi:hypothetical protein
MTTKANDKSLVERILLKLAETAKCAPCIERAKAAAYAKKTKRAAK